MLFTGLRLWVSAPASPQAVKIRVTPWIRTLALTLAKLTPQDVLHIAQAHAADRPCPDCQVFACPGWESFPAAASESLLEPLGALWVAEEGEEPTVAELRAPGIDAWSPLAPVALRHHPYNRCEVWRCVSCQRPFLRYTEYGGYYVDRRIRELDVARIVPDDL